LAVLPSPLTLSVALQARSERLQGRPSLVSGDANRRYTFDLQRQGCAGTTGLRECCSRPRASAAVLGGHDAESWFEALVTWLSTQGDEPRASVHSTCSATPRQWRLGSVRANSVSARAFRPASSETDKTRPAGCCNPHFKDEHPWRCPVDDAFGRAEERRRAPRSTTLGPLQPADPVAPEGLSRSARARTKGWPLTSRRRLEDAGPLMANPLVPGDRDRFPRRFAESGGFPDPERLPPARSPCEPSADSASFNPRFAPSTSIRPWRITARG